MPSRTWGRVCLIRFAAVTGDTVDIIFDFGRVPEVRFIKVFGGDIERGKFR